MLSNELIIDRSSTSSYFQVLLLRDGTPPSVFIRKYDTAAVVAIIRMQGKHALHYYTAHAHAQALAR